MKNNIFTIIVLSLTVTLACRTLFAQDKTNDVPDLVKLVRLHTRSADKLNAAEWQILAGRYLVKDGQNTFLWENALTQLEIGKAEFEKQVEEFKKDDEKLKKLAAENPKEFLKYDLTREQGKKIDDDIAKARESVIDRIEKVRVVLRNYKELLDLTAKSEEQMLTSSETEAAKAYNEALTRIDAIEKFDWKDFYLLTHEPNVSGEEFELQKKSTPLFKENLKTHLTVVYVQSLLRLGRQLGDAALLAKAVEKGKELKNATTPVLPFLMGQAALEIELLKTRKDPTAERNIEDAKKYFADAKEKAKGVKNLEPQIDFYQSIMKPQMFLTEAERLTLNGNLQEAEQRLRLGTQIHRDAKIWTELLLTLARREADEKMINDTLTNAAKVSDKSEERKIAIARCYIVMAERLLDAKKDVGGKLTGISDSIKALTDSKESADLATLAKLTTLYHRINKEAANVDEGNKYARQVLATLPEEDKIKELKPNNIANYRIIENYVLAKSALGYCLLVKSGGEKNDDQMDGIESLDDAAEYQRRLPGIANGISVDRQLVDTAKRTGIELETGLGRDIRKAKQKVDDAPTAANWERYLDLSLTALQLSNKTSNDTYETQISELTEVDNAPQFIKDYYKGVIRELQGELLLSVIASFESQISELTEADNVSQFIEDFHEGVIRELPDELQLSARASFETHISELSEANNDKQFIKDFYEGVIRELQGKLKLSARTSFEKAIDSAEEPENKSRAQAKAADLRLQLLKVAVK
ncbi:MAG: hypothetical protein LBU65_05030 [Planctomycetaceae bacterium]|jgi:hypothetical protein|nr:hypothetical protein [Planctomycetaceae bacterium]